MKEQISEYVISLYRDIPMAVYEGLLSVLCLGVVFIIVCYGLKRRLKWIAGLLSVEYIFLIFCSTVIYRKGYEGAGYELSPFWSYTAIQEGRVELLTENIMNVVVFVPVGMLLCMAFKQMTWWKVLLVGCSISAVIELLQFFLMRGFSELDDVMHNTLGCLIGFGIISILRIIFKTRYNNV